MTDYLEVSAGAVVRSTVTLEPETGTVDVAHVTCKYATDFGTTDDLTDAVTAGEGANVFTVEFATPDDTPTSIWRLRWESNSPSPRIVVENDDPDSDQCTTFKVRGSAIPNP